MSASLGFDGVGASFPIERFVIGIDLGDKVMFPFVLLKFVLIMAGFFVIFFLYLGIFS
jgi:hypothetical protein